MHPVERKMTFEIGQTVKKLSRLCDEPQRISEALFDGNFEWYRLEFGGGAWHKPEELTSSVKDASQENRLYER
jgi:hypothetical protein